MHSAEERLENPLLILRIESYMPARSNKDIQKIIKLLLKVLGTKEIWLFECFVSSDPLTLANTVEVRTST